MDVKILYKNGVEKEYRIPITEDNYSHIKNVQDSIKESFENDYGGYITIGDGDNYGTFVKLDEVVEVKFEVVKEESV